MQRTGPCWQISCLYPMTAEVGARDQHAAHGCDGSATFMAIPFIIDGPKLSDGIGLCLSGGGYRAMLFHAGALLRLNEAGLLSKLDRISSVSGGSIAAGALAAACGRLTFENGIATNLEAD